jgi:hypothetical protein
MALEVQGMNLERYAQLGRLLEPFGGRLKSVDADRVVFDVSGSADQLRSQLSLAKLQEVPAADVASVPVNAGQAPVPGAAPIPQAPQTSAQTLHFRW